MYVKVNFDEQKPLNSANLNKMETQYDEVFNDLGTIRVDTTAELIVQVVSADPAGTTAYMIFNTTANRFKYYNGSAWVDLALPGGATL